MSDNQKIFKFGLLKDIFLIIAGLIISNFAILTKTNIDQKYQDKIKQEEKMSKFRDELSVAIGERFYYMSKYFQALNSGDFDKIYDSKKEYDKVNINWNANIHRYIALVKFHYNNKMREYFEQKISNKLAKIAREIDENNFDKKSISSKFKEVSSSIVGFNIGLYEFKKENK